MNIYIKLIICVSSLGCMSTFASNDDASLVIMSIFLFGWSICSMLNFVKDYFNTDYSYGYGNVYGNRSYGIQRTNPYPSGINSTYRPYVSVKDKDVIANIAKTLKISKNASICNEDGTIVVVKKK